MSVLRTAAAFLARLALLLPGAALAIDYSTVWVVLSEFDGPYAEVLQAMRAEFDRAGEPRPALNVLRPENARELARVGGQGAVVAVGARAVQAVAASEVRQPVLNVLVPRQLFERVAAQNGRTDVRRFSAIFLDQPITRQLNLLRAALPERRSVGVLYGAESRQVGAVLESAGAGRNLRLITERVDSADELHASLMKVLEGADVLLALPDSLVHNGATIKGILLATYRKQVPVVAFSPAYVRAGALLAVYSTPAQIGRQTAELLRHALESGYLPPPQFPRYFEVAANDHVAHSLGIRIEEEAALSERLRQMERAP